MTPLVPRALVAGLILLLAGCATHIHAPTVRPPVVPRGPLPAAVAIDVSGVPAESLCSSARDQGGGGELCIEDLRPALADGLRHVMSRYMNPVEAEPADYRAELAITRLYHFEEDSRMAASPGGGHHSVSSYIYGLVYQFRLRRTSDQMPVAQGGDSIELREPIEYQGEADDAVRELLTRVLVRVSEHVQDSVIWDAPSA